MGAAYERDEDTGERLDRNWQDILQELRVIQTGVQLLSGFLLTLPFSAASPSSTRGRSASTWRSSWSPPSRWD